MDKNVSKLPLLAMDEIPEPRPGAQEIVALVREGGRVTGYKLSDGRVVDKAKGVQLAKDGGISGVGVATRNGNEYLKSIPDGDEGNNLSNLSSVTTQQEG